MKTNTPYEVEREKLLQTMKDLKESHRQLTPQEAIDLLTDLMIVGNEMHEREED